MNPRHPSSSDERAPTDTRQQYRELTPMEQAAVLRIKSAGQALIDEIHDLNQTHETEIALIRAQEAVMWAVRGITG